MMLGLTSEEQKLLRAMCTQHLTGTHALVWLFGSRARGDHRDMSDVDLAIGSPQPLPIACLSELSASLDESTLPFRVDVIDKARTDHDFWNAIQKERILLWTDETV